MRNRKGVEPSDELKAIVRAEPQNAVAVETTPAQQAQQLLANDAQQRANECAQRCAAICQELRCTQAARTVAYGAQTITEIIYIAN